LFALSAVGPLFALAARSDPMSRAILAISFAFGFLLVATRTLLALMALATTLTIRAIRLAMGPTRSIGRFTAPRRH
jgi:hypothetical protein